MFSLSTTCKIRANSAAAQKIPPAGKNSPKKALKRAQTAKYGENPLLLDVKFLEHSKILTSDG
jgi:hypothetical protein